MQPGAQPGGAIFSEPPTLPPPPVLERLLLESGMWSAAAVALAGGLVALLLARRGEGKAAMFSAGGALILAIAAGLASTLIETDRERIGALARALIDAVRAGEPARGAPILHESVRVVVSDQPVDGLDKPALLSLIDQVRLDELALLDNQALVESPGAGVSQLQLRARVESFPSLSWWKLDWRLDDAGEWVVVAIEPILINGRSPSGALAGEMRSRSQ